MTPEAVTSGRKKCSSCGEVKDFSDFHNDKSTSGGMSEGDFSVEVEGTRVTVTLNDA